MSHMQDRPDDWRAATDQEHLDALMNRQPFIDPRWMAYLQQWRPHVICQSIRLHEATGGYVSPIAQRFLRRQGRGGLR